MRTELKQPYNQFFGTMANQYRIEIIEALNKGPKNVTQICKATNFLQPTVSHNMKRLLECGFVHVERKGRDKIFTLNKNTIKPLLDIMHKHMRDYCCKVCMTKEGRKKWHHTH